MSATIGGLDAEEVLRSARRLQVLADVSHTFATVARDYSQLLEKVARTTADLVGDGCQVTLVDADGETLTSVANAHRDPTLEAIYREFLAGQGVSKTTSATVSAQVVRSGEPKLMPEIRPEEVVAKTDEALRPLIARLSVHSFVVVPIRAGAAILGTLSLMRSGPGRGYTPEDLSLLQDMADRAGLAIENARLYGDLERRVRARTAELEAVAAELEAFSYSVAHDLRAPLRSIDGFSLALLEDSGDRLDAGSQRHLERVRDAAQRMSLLIDGLLDLSRVMRTELHRVRVDVSDMARQVVARLREADPDRDVEVVIAEGLVADADPRLFEALLTNLLGNAWKFTSKRPTARIEVGARGEGPRELFVKDDGAGFAPEYAHRLFGAFQRLHGADEFTGTGIGLATVQRIVRRHGGRIRAEGEVGRGATFSFTLEPDAD